MEDIELLSYLLVFALSIIFSAFSVERRSAIFSFMAFASWGVMSACHLSLAYTSDFIILAWLFVVLASIFFLYGFALIIMSFQIKKRQKEWQI